MALFSVETRELRSFRLRHRIEELRSVIEDKNTDGVFCISNSLHPIEREELRGEFNTRNINVISLSKNIVRFLFIDSKWKNVRNLLEGQIFFVRDRNNKLLTKDFLLSMTQSEKFTLRLFLHNQQLYRKENLIKLLSNVEQKKPVVGVVILLKHLLIQRNIILFTKKLTLNVN